VYNFAVDYRTAGLKVVVDVQYKRLSSSVDGTWEGREFDSKRPGKDCARRGKQYSVKRDAGEVVLDP
jgi:hypothetical protein